MKKIIAFLCFFAGGSMLLFILSLAGCRDRKVVFIYKSFHTEINEGDGSVFRIINAMDTCRYNLLFTRIQLETTELMAALPLPGNAVYANQYGTTYKNLEKITDIKVIPLYTYNAQHPAGADMADSLWFWNESLPNGNPWRKAALLEQVNKNYDDFAENLVKIFTFKPVEAPANAGLQQFAIEFRTNKNAVLRDTSVVFFLKP